MPSTKYSANQIRNLFSTPTMTGPRGPFILDIRFIFGEEPCVGWHKVSSNDGAPYSIYEIEERRYRRILEGEMDLEGRKEGFVAPLEYPNQPAADEKFAGLFSREKFKAVWPTLKPAIDAQEGKKLEQTRERKARERKLRNSRQKSRTGGGSSSSTTDGNQHKQTQVVGNSVVVTQPEQQSQPPTQKFENSVADLLTENRDHFPSSCLRSLSDHYRASV
ncbi:hypothetical protein BDP27DRAFT_1337054 [Rhodocollybia butyracea]|uniref:Uncharacterized protein n=1 Tax=Rhodocollybia butyracea TaxID=206335 RepID=A0A9P5PDZ7_9AGAR|nr:hypothetical protein BDP27DRAFT_1337054 [Rhodocollybia butyracea]